MMKGIESNGTFASTTVYIEIDFYINWLNELFHFTSTVKIGFSSFL